MQDRIFCCNKQLRLIGKSHNRINRNIIIEHELTENLDMTVILPDRVPEGILLSITMTPVSPVRQILHPKLSVSAAVNLSVNILRLNHENAETGDDNVVYLMSKRAVTQEQVIIDTITGSR